MKLLTKQKSSLWQMVFFLILSILYLIAIHPTGRSYFDSNGYINLAKSFFIEGDFSLLNYPLDIRGVWFPLILSPFYEYFAWLGWKPLSAIVMVFFVYFFPQMLLEKREFNYLFLRRIITFFLLCMFWSGVFIYPLTDAVALLLFSTGIWCILKHSKLGYSIGALLFYIAYNTRTIYLFPIMAIVIGYIVLLFLKDRKRVIPCLLAMFIGGMVIAPIPQVIVNYNNYGTISIEVITVDDESYPQGLFVWQLAEGLKLMQYETNINEESGYPIGGIRFEDPVGMKLLEEEGMDSLTMSMSDFMKVVFKYPADVIGIYIRHFINMLNPVWGEVYIKNIHKLKLHLTLLNYSMLFLGTAKILMTYLGRNKERRFKDIILSKGEKWLIYLVIIMPCIMILPGAIEQRFFFPMYMLLYVLIVYRISKEDLVKIWTHCKKEPMVYTLAFMIGLLIICCVCSNTYANNSEGIWIGFI